MTTSTGRSARPSYLLSDELGTPAELAADGREAGRHLDLPVGRQRRLERAVQAAVAPVPSIRFEDYPAEVSKREVRFSDAAASLAASLHLHLD